jgi:phosphoglycolate phosphatase
MKPHLAMPRLVLVDLDGTLVDTLPDLSFCVDRMLAELGLPGVSAQSVRAWVGNGTEALVRRALSTRDDRALDGDRLAEAQRIFTRLYARHASDRSHVFDGARTALDFFDRAGVALACVTNKAAAFTDKLLADLGLDSCFDLVISGDTLARKKPDPMPLLHAVDHFRVQPADALLVGDSTNDVKAARAAGMSVVCVTYGYNHGEDIRASAPDALVDSLAELPQLFSPPCRAGTAS